MNSISLNGKIRVKKQTKTRELESEKTRVNEVKPRLKCRSRIQSQATQATVRVWLLVRSPFWHFAFVSQEGIIDVRLSHPQPQSYVKFTRKCSLFHVQSCDSIHKKLN
jgi:hypothetical protein